MQTASFTGFIRILFYILAFYYIFKFLAKLLLPLIVKKVVKKAGENYQQQQEKSQDTSWKKGQSRDEIIYNDSNSKKPRETKKVGDYVDYEELD
ncbi:MAG: hypothetical protein ACI9Q9_000737 [Flavobacterium sp.]|jgi:hypothetical protein